MKTKHNRNYQRIDNAIINAYKGLLKEKGKPDTSITDLCAKAGVNRTTFYKHYQGIHEITDRLEDQLIYSIFNIEESKGIGIDEFLHNPRPALEILNKNVMDNYDYYKSMFRPERIRFIIEKVITILADIFKEDFPKLAQSSEVMTKVRLNLCDFVASVVGLYVHWLNGYLDCEISNVSNHIVTVITHVYKGVKIPE